jgi:hypothetical protein
VVGETALVYAFLLDSFFIEATDETEVGEILLIDAEFLSKRAECVDDDTGNDVDEDDKQKEVEDVIEEPAREDHL